MARVDRRLAAIATAALTTLGGLAVATPAEARAAGKEQCKSGWFCVWQNYAYGGDFARVQKEEPRWHNLPSGQNCQAKTFNDCASSYWNRTSDTYRLYEHVNFNGEYIDVCAGSSSNVPMAWNDRLSSSKKISNDASDVC